MTRLYDKFLRELPAASPQRGLLQRCTVLAIDNVARYYFEVSDQEVWSVLTDFPNIAPPLPAMFLEYKTPKTINSGKLGTHEFNHDVVSIGIAMFAHDRDPEQTFAYESVQLSGVRWFMETAFFLETSRGIYPYVVASIRYPVTPDGRWLSLDGKTIVKTFALGEHFARQLGIRDGDDEALMTATNMIGEECEGLLFPALLALSFAHCKNVTLTEIRPEDWMMRAARKKKRPIPVIYHVLDIEPMKTVLRTEGQSEKTGLKKALHICWGHFKTYDEKPLFGRVKGTFWWPSTVRGSLSEGAVVKDYRIHEPKTPTT